MQNMENLFSIALQRKEIPQKLYKYMSVDTAEAVLQSNTLQFSHRSSFNDIYECTGYIKRDYSPVEWKQHLEKLGVHGIVRDSSVLNNLLKEKIDECADGLGILCLTQKNDNLLMWAHYADNHQGVCFEFDLSKDLKTFCFPKKVNYGIDYPKIDFINDQPSATNVIFYKSVDWCYEKEYRVIDLYAYKNAKAGNIKPVRKSFNREALTGIYFGCRCSDKDIKKIKDVAIRSGYINAQFYKMVQNDIKYQLVVCSC